MATTPRIRPDLTAVAVDEDGTRWYDVTDPRTGQVHRLYDFEWRIAQRMDGAVDFEALAAWARDDVGTQVDAPGLEVFAERLRELGLVETLSAPAESLRKAITGSWAAIAPDAKSAGKANPSKVAALVQTVKQPEADVEEMKKFFRKAPDAEAFTRMRKKRATVSSGVISGIGIVAVTAALPLIFYFSFVRAAPPKPVHVTTATPRDVLELYEGAAPARRAAPVAVSFAVGGTLAQIVPAGTLATTRMPLATLAEREKAESELTHLQHRQEHYEKQLGIDPKAQKKLAEKKKLIADLQAKVTQMQLLAPQAGAVVTVEAKPGDKVAPGQPVLHLADPMLHTVFNVPVFDAGSMGDGASVRLKAENGRLIPAHVARVQGEVVNVDVDANTGLKDGEPVRLVKAWLSGMVKLPASTVVQRGGVNTVFVLADGEAKARPVVVYDREGDEVRIMKGLNAGEQAIVDPPPLIQDGDKAVLAR